MQVLLYTDNSKEKGSKKMDNTVSSIVEAIKKYSVETPNQLCIADKKRQATYKEFWELIKRGATYLKNNGVKKGDIIAIRCMQKFEFVCAFFSIQLAGAAGCPLEKAIKEDRILEIMNFVNSDIYISDKGVKKEGIKNISLKEMFKAITDEENPITPEEFELPKADELSEILFTTGTTGKSKGIEIINQNDIAIAQNVAGSIGKTSSDVELITAPLNHSMALRRMYTDLYTGGAIIITDGVKFVEDFFRLLDEFNVNAISFVPAILEQVLKFAKDRFGKYKDQLKYIQFGSAPLSETNKELLLEMFPNTRFFNIYGSTESGCVIAHEFSKYGDKEKCIGKPAVNVKVLFVDENRNVIEHTTADKPGFLGFVGKMNMRGYFNEPELTKEVLDDNGVVYTNDVGYLGEDGFVYLLVRQGEVINMGGIKIAPTEIEEVVDAHEMIKESACIPIPDDITGEAPKLFVVLNDGYEFDQKELVKYMNSKLEGIKVPKVFQVIDEVPRTFNGKIIRKKLKELNSK